MAYLAIDLGAGSGRVIVGEIKDNKITLDEVHRFSDRQVLLGDTLYWDFPGIFSEIKTGINKAVQKGYTLKSIAVDSWGVDFGLLDNKGRLLSNPVCYRDNRTTGILSEAFKLISKEQMYAVTGNQFMEINSVFQLFSLVKENNPQLKIADKLLFIPDLVNYFLTGFIGNEYTIASTSQLLNAQTRNWEPEIFKALDIPQNLMSEIIQPGTVIGQLRPEIAIETGTGNIDVIAVGSHDTASAIAAIPADGSNWAFLSSGTWSLLGIESPHAIMTTEALENDFTNEGGVGGKIRFLRNITGLWILQRYLAEVEKATGTPIEYDVALPQANATQSIGTIINPDAPEFANPQSMKAAIDDYCRASNQTIPNNQSEYIRTILESLAAKYADVIKKLNQCSAKSIDCLYVVGGGCKNDLLNQLTANATGIPVIAASPESTSLGNIMMQAIGTGEIANLEEGRKLIAKSINTKKYLPLHFH